MPLMEDPVCVFCGNSGSRRCSRCRAVRYCSSKCQEKHWKSGHKTECKGFQLSGRVNSAQNTVATGDEEETETIQDLRQATRKGKKRAANQGELQKKEVDKKGKKNGGAAKLCGQIDRLVEAYESRTSANLLMRSLHIGTSIPEVIAAVAQLPGCEPPSELWLFATCLFCSADMREMFATIKDPEVQLTWLKFMFNKQQ